MTMPTTRVRTGSARSTTPDQAAPRRSDRSKRAAGTRRPPHSLTGQLLLYLTLAYALSWWPWPLSDLQINPDAGPDDPDRTVDGGRRPRARLHGWRGGRDLLRSLLDVRIGRWWLAVLLPVLIATGAAMLAVVAGAPAPGGDDVAQALAAAAITLPLIMVVGGPLGEELGWRGFVLPTLLKRHGPIAATLILTPMWIAFHLPWILNEPAQFGPVWALAILGMALTMTWLYLRTRGSLALAVVFHAVINTCTAAAIQLFPERDRALAWGIAAALWLLTGLVAASQIMGPARRPSGLVRRLGPLVARHPVGWFLALALGIGWSTLGFAVAIPVTPTGSEDEVAPGRAGPPMGVAHRTRAVISALPTRTASVLRPKQLGGDLRLWGSWRFRPLVEVLPRPSGPIRPAT